jgi:hydroxymethylglutaryl-CoA reductase (NADPH)
MNSLLFRRKRAGGLRLEARMGVTAPSSERVGHIPHDPDPFRDHRPQLVAERVAFVEALSGGSLACVADSSIDPSETIGNIENLIGAAQIPLGIAGPLRIDGEHARGDFLVPLATTEGSLVASYSRGMKVLTLAGGVLTTISGDAMQRAPVFVFASARRARDFVDWLLEHFDDIRTAAESTSRVARLLRIEPFLANKFAFVRFNFSTGDAAGQNMVGKATFAAYQWILANNATVVRAFLESNFATDKKPSHVNVLHPRGKRVTAEATIPRALLREHLRVQPEQLVHHWGVANVGALLSGANNNGCHSANAITALFIATGQDVANVAEGAAATTYAELTKDGDLYFSITIPSLIVATHGGGTHLPTQRECLALLGCAGAGTVNKLAEIVAATVLSGELSLAAAISSLEWVAAHERLGRNR